MKFILTGSSGFFGSYIVKELLENNHEVIVLLRIESNKKRLDIFKNHTGYKEYFIDDEDIVKKVSNFKPDIFIHSAWKGVDNLKRNDFTNIEENINILTKSIDLANKIGCRKWIGVGSLTEYGNLEKMYFEDNVPIPTTIYAKTKLICCMLSRLMCESLTMQWNWVRLGPIYGVGDNENWLIPYLIKSLKKGETPKLTKCEQIWDYLHVEDAAEAIVKLAISNNDGIYNLCSSLPIQLNEIVRLVFFGTQIEPLLGHLKYNEDQLMYMVGSNEKLKKTIDWEPQKNINIEINKLKK